MKRRSDTLDRAYAFQRLSVKARKAGENTKADQYAKTARRLLGEHRKQKAAMADWMAPLKPKQ